MTVSLIHPNRPAADVVWHYTTSEGLLGILSSHTIFATSSRHLNDSREIVYGRQRVRDRFRAACRAKRWSPADQKAITGYLRRLERNELGFLACASTDGDAVSQWRAYAGSTGFAVGLRSGSGLALLGDPSPDFKQPEWEFPHLVWRSVVYEDAAQEEMMIELLRHLSLDTTYGVDRYLDVGQYSYWNTAYTIKDGRFADEREVRILAGVPKDLTCTEFRTTRFGLTPYVRLTGSQDASGYVALEACRLPIECIRVGPTEHGEAQASAVEQALDRYGYRSTKVLLSDVSLR